MDKKDHSFTTMFTSEGRQGNRAPEREDRLHYVCDPELPNIDDVAGNMRNIDICKV